MKKANINMYTDPEFFKVFGNQIAKHPSDISLHLTRLKIHSFKTFMTDDKGESIDNTFLFSHFSSMRGKLNIFKGSVTGPSKCR